MVIYQNNSLSNTFEKQVKLPKSINEKPKTKEEWTEEFNKKAPAHISYHANKSHANKSNGK